MDVVLEAFDSYLFDPIYARLLPAAPAYNALRTNSSAAFSRISEVPTAYYNNYKFKRASEYIQFTPGLSAHLTSLPRDNPFRQFLSLYLITA